MKSYPRFLVCLFWLFSVVVLAGCDASGGATGEAQVEGSVGVDEEEEETPVTPGTGSVVDSDSDGVADDKDNCWLVANANQVDGDADGVGAVC
ncbi:MAG: hypothetical protein ABW171_04085, partial [Steroidobacter sp.]